MKDMLEALKELVAIESVAEPGCTLQGCPYGAGVNRALHYVLALCKQFGFRTKDCNGNVGWAEIGSGSPMTGILVHLDTVPIGEGWSVEQGTVQDGILYGRGVIDDKGPTIACIYAMKELLDAGLPMEGRIRLIFGQMEETGNWKDIEYYKQHEELPDCGFTPDADFPLIFAEKGLCVLQFQTPAGADLLQLTGGTACNVVPSECQCQLRMEDGSTKILCAKGKSAHGSMPDNGVNAISLLMQQIYEMHAMGKAHVPFSQFYHDCIGMNLHGEAIGCDVSDVVSGRLTMNCGTICLENGIIKMAADIRYPVQCDYEALLTQIKAKAIEYGVDVSCTMHMKPVNVSLDTPFVQTLLGAYQSVPGDNCDPIAIGGGTYARAMEHIVAFGALLPGRPLTEHQADEHVAVEDLYTAKEIYYEALKALHTKAEKL